jgi:hypothetical protein
MKGGKEGGMAIKGFSITIKEKTNLSFANITDHL